MIGIVAICRNKGIGLNGHIQWHIKEDLAFFKKMTLNSIVIMGRRTYESIGKPLCDRINVVITKSPDKYSSVQNSFDNIFFVRYENVFDMLKRFDFMYPNVFVIGGKEIYELFFEHLTTIYLTHIDKKYEHDTVFPKIPSSFVLKNFSEKQFSEAEQCTFRFLKYERTDSISNCDETYLNLSKKILESKSKIRNNRTNIPTISLFGEHVEFDISSSIPLLTTKRMAWKSCIEELLWFLRGNTDANILKEKNVNIWNGNSSKEFLKNVGLEHLEEGDCGANYSFQWRYFGQEYVDSKSPYTKDTTGDQISYILNLLKNDPYSRRIFLSAWNPNQLNKTVLPPCHVSCQFFVDDSKKLSCHMYQRSCDVFLGLPFNIFSYAVLTHILAKKSDLIPDKLFISFGDAHIYSNHVEQVKEQLSRTTLSSPQLLLNESIKNKNIEEISIDDFEVIGYFPYPSIKGHMAI